LFFYSYFRAREKEIVRPVSDQAKIAGENREYFREKEKRNREKVK
jgi:hypothetical protein